MNSERMVGAPTQAVRKRMSLNARSWLHDRRVDVVVSVTLSAASFLLYLRTMAPDIVYADGGEFQFAAWTFSIVHPTGYPLFLILGGLFQHLIPLGNPAFRLNLFTVLTAALAIPIVYQIVLSLTNRRAAAAIAAASLALSSTFWRDAGGAEVYAFYGLLLALLLFAALRWMVSPTFGGAALFFAILGFALTHHRAILLWLPAFALLGGIVAWQRRHSVWGDHQVARALALACLVLLPLILYLYVPLRSQESPFVSISVSDEKTVWLYDNTLDGFVDYVLGRTFQSELTWDQVSERRFFALPFQILTQFGPLGALLGAVGIAAMIRKREWTSLLLCGAGAVATLIFAAIYHIADIEHYYIPVYIVWAIWIGMGFAGAVDLFRMVLPSRADRLLFPSLAIYVIVGIALLLFQFLWNYPAADRSGEDARAEWSRILASNIPENAILITNDRDEMTPFWYLQSVERVRQDLLGVFPLITPSPEHSNIVALTDSMLESGRPVIFIKQMRGIQVRYQLDTTNLPTVRVLGKIADTSPMYPSNTVVGERVHALGYDVSSSSENLTVNIKWQVVGRLDSNYVSFVHLLDGRVKVAQGDDHLVGGVFYPSSLWQVGEQIQDTHVVHLPPGLASGSLDLLAGFYRRDDMKELGEPVIIGTVQVKR